MYHGIRRDWLLRVHKARLQTLHRISVLKNTRGWVWETLFQVVLWKKGIMTVTWRKCSFNYVLKSIVDDVLSTSIQLLVFTCLDMRLPRIEKEKWNGLGQVVIVNDMCSEVLLIRALLLHAWFGGYRCQEPIFMSLAGVYLITECVYSFQYKYENHYLYLRLDDTLGCDLCTSYSTYPILGPDR